MDYTGENGTKTILFTSPEIDVNINLLRYENFRVLFHGSCIFVVILLMILILEYTHLNSNRDNNINVVNNNNVNGTDNSTNNLFSSVPSCSVFFLLCRF